MDTIKVYVGDKELSQVSELGKNLALSLAMLSLPKSADANGLAGITIKGKEVTRRGISEEISTSDEWQSIVNSLLTGKKVTVKRSGVNQKGKPKYTEVTFMGENLLVIAKNAMLAIDSNVAINELVTRVVDTGSDDDENTVTQDAVKSVTVASLAELLA